MKLSGFPARVTVGTEHVTLTAVDADNATTVCTCGHQCVNPAHCAGWAHGDHTRTHTGDTRPEQNGRRP